MAGCSEKVLGPDKVRWWCGHCFPLEEGAGMAEDTGDDSDAGQEVLEEQT